MGTCYPKNGLKKQPKTFREENAHTKMRITNAKMQSPKTEDKQKSKNGIFEKVPKMGTCQPKNGLKKQPKKTSRRKCAYKKAHNKCEKAKPQKEG